MKEKLRRYAGLALPVLAAAFYLYIAFCVPYCHDDWDWGLDIGLQRWLHAEVNSRYVGNFFVILMTRSEIVKTLVMAVCLTAIPLLITWLSVGKYEPKTFLFANLLLLIVPQKLWQQTVGWVSAFANYVVSAGAVLLLLLLLRRQWGRKHYGSIDGLLRLGGMLLLSAACGLFYENLSVWLFAAALIGLGCCIPRKNRDNIPLLAACTLGAGAGLALILSNSLYGELMDSGQALGGIRQLSFSVESRLPSLVMSIAGRYFKTLLPGLLTVNPVLTVFTAAAAIAGALTGKSRKAESILLSLLSAVCAALLLWGENEMLSALAAVVLLLCWAQLAYLKGEGLARKLFCLLSAAAVLAPLSITPELGPRLYYFPAVLLCAFALSMLPRLDRRGVTGLLLLLLALSMGFYLFIYSEIRSVTIARAEAIRSAKETGASSVILPRDPYKYWWGRNPTGESRVPYFREFYGIPPEMEVIFE